MSLNTAIIVLGMHRSGTSCLAGSLQQHGLYLGQVFEWNPHNKKGNRENSEIMRLNNQLLLHNQSSWDHPKVCKQWTQKHESQRDQILGQFIESEYKVWGFKCPRTLFTLDFWMQGLKDVEVKFVGTIRHPIAVANSLLARNKMPIESGLALWASYCAQFLLLHDREKFPLISFDVDLEEYLRSLKWITGILPILPLQPETNYFIDDSLRKNRSESYDDLPQEVIQIYSQLTTRYQEQFR